MFSRISKFWFWHWDGLGPGTPYCSGCIWMRYFWSNKIQRNYKGLKITARICSWSKLWTKRQKTNKQKPNNCHFWRARSKCRVSGVKAGMCPLHATPPKGWANRLSHPSDPTHGHTLPSPHMKNHLTPGGASKGTCYLLLLPRCCSRAPVKLCLNFLSGL